MATLWIREFSEVPMVGGKTPGSSFRDTSPAPMCQEPGTDQTPLTFSTSARSAAFGANTKYIIIVSSVDFHYKIDTNAAAPVATTNHLKLPANTPWAIGVREGDKIAAIQAV